MLNKLLNTIVSVITPRGHGGVGIIRLSGSLSLSISRYITKKKLVNRKVIFTHFFLNNNVLLDKGLSIYFKAPNSFTGEDVVEFHIHGNDILLDSLVTRCISLGSRQSEPGEFSFRSYYNNKIDLLQAESINQLIRSNSLYGSQIILKSLYGDFSKKIEYILNKLSYLRGNIEASIDFPYDVEFDYKKFSKEFYNVMNKFDNLFSRILQNNLFYDNFKIVIIGKSNVGKSSLFNMLLKKERSIISNMLGTTRDYICDFIKLENSNLCLIDTAGLNVLTKNKIEKIGINKSYCEIKKANILIYVIDILDNFYLCENNVFCEILNINNNLFNIFVIVNKIDKVLLSSGIYLNNKYTKIYMSVKKEIGINILFFKIKNMFLNFSKNVYIVNKRHYKLILEANNYMLQLKNDIIMKNSIEFLAENLKCLHNCFIELLGKNVPEDIISEIFKDFCVGK